MVAIDEVGDAYAKARLDPDFLAELDRLAENYAGRPSPVTDAARLTDHVGGARFFLKREDLNHTGSHKINNVLGQALLARAHGQDGDSSPRPAPDSTAWPPPPPRRCWVWSAPSTWAGWTPTGRR